RDKTGVAWIDPSSREAWEYNARIAREMSKRGFDEIQFDYVRFPSDGVLSTIRYTVYDSAVSKTDALLEFFKFINGLRSEGIRVSADVFGIIMNSDQGRPIGQLLANVYPYVDFISPMVYPS
ncbi:TPA: hypothetical protein DCZ32_00300, partial [Candidatus Uhrbacteria bacterium]|nr:hypothetical protein [Candidatus Uhrbacteria bacterium]